MLKNVYFLIVSTAAFYSPSVCPVAQFYLQSLEGLLSQIPSLLWASNAQFNTGRRCRVSASCLLPFYQNGGINYTNVRHGDVVYG